MVLTGLVQIFGSAAYHYCYLLLILVWVSFVVSSLFYRQSNAEALLKQKT